MLANQNRLSRANLLEWVCRSCIGDRRTDDRVTWRTTDGVWLAQLQRSPNGRRVYLGLVTITQQVGDLADGGHGETILTNAAQVLLLKQKAETIDTATAWVRLTPDER